VTRTEPDRPDRDPNTRRHLRVVRDDEVSPHAPLGGQGSRRHETDHGSGPAPSGPAPVAPMVEGTRASIATYGAAAHATMADRRDARPVESARAFARIAGRDAWVLDAAAGPATDVRLLCDVGLRPVAGDASESAIRACAHLFPKRPLACWDVRNLPFPAATFAGIWAPAALQHLPRQQLRAAFGELRRVHAAGPIMVSFREGGTDLAPVVDHPAGQVYATALQMHELRALLADQGYQKIDVSRHSDSRLRGVTWVSGWALAGER